MATHPPLRLGYFPEPKVDDVAGVLARARLAEAEGLDLVALQDHPYSWRQAETFTLLAAIAADTRRIHLASDVANLPLRPPAVLAKTAATVARVSGDRFHLGVGAGGFWDAIAAMGGPRRSPAEALTALEEAIAVCRLMWSGERSVRYDGSFHRLAGTRPGPAPAQPIDVWVGAIGPRMLALTGRVADGWLPSSPYVPPDRLAESIARIEDAAVAAGRDPAAVERIYNVSGSITEARSDDFLVGPPEQWVDQLAELVLDVGMTGFVLMAQQPELEQLRRFAAEVAPALRELVAAERG